MGHIISLCEQSGFCPGVNAFICGVRKDGQTWGSLRQSSMRNLWTNGIHFFFDEKVVSKHSDDSGTTWPDSQGTGKISPDQWEIAKIVIGTAARQNQHNDRTPLSLKVSGKSRTLWFSDPGDKAKLIEHVDTVQRDPNVWSISQTVKE